MRKGIDLQATLVNLGGQALPPVVLNISKRFQFCVDAGAAAAVGFFDAHTSVGLHDHIAMSMHLFMCSMRTTVDSMPIEPMTPDVAQDCTDAFAAGYLGRVHQELRLFRDERSGGCVPACSSSERCTASAAFQNVRH